MNKKGSHVEFILSFAIFITFIVFLFVVFNPRINFKQNKEPILNHLETELLIMFDSDLTNINNVANEYYDDYEGLKANLEVPENVEFAFIFIDDGIENIVAEKDVPEDINIYTKEVLVLYDDNKKAGFLTIKVW